MRRDKTGADTSACLALLHSYKLWGEESSWDRGYSVHVLAYVLFTIILASFTRSGPLPRANPNCSLVAGVCGDEAVQCYVVLCVLSYIVMLLWWVFTLELFEFTLWCLSAG